MSNFRLIDRDTGFPPPPSVDEWLLAAASPEPRRMNADLARGLVGALAAPPVSLMLAALPRGEWAGLLAHRMGA